MSFTDGTRQVTTEKHLSTKWGGRTAYVYFRCRMCGHRFQIGDGWRFVYTNGLEGGRYGGNPLVCDACDGPDVIDRWKALCDEAYSDKFWWFMLNRG